MCYRGGRGVVPTAGIRSGQMIMKFRGLDTRHGHADASVAYWRGRATMLKGILCHVKCHWGNVNVIQAWPITEIHDMSGKHLPVTISLLSGGAVRRSSLRCAPFGPPTVSCVLAPARTCLRQAPPTSRDRGLATSAVPHHLTDDMSIKRTFFLEKRCKKTSFFSPFQKI